MRGAARRLSWGLADQAVSSLTNFAVSVYAARSLDLADFGLFSLAWVTYAVILNVSRGMATDPLTVRFSAVPHQQWHAAVGHSSGSALLIGLAAGSLSLTIGLLLGSGIGPAFLALGAVLPGLLLQDAWRYALFAAGEGRRACSNDLVRAVVLVPALLLAARHDTVVGFLLAWGAASTVAAVCGGIQLRVLPRLPAARSWFRRHRDLGSRYLVENVSVSGSTQILMYALGAIAGAADVGTLRGAELLMGPFMTVLMGVTLFAVPEGARLLRDSSGNLRRFCFTLGMVQASGALAWGAAVLLLLPESAGRSLLGQVWPSASTLIVPATLSLMCASMREGAIPGLRALGASRRSLLTQLTDAGVALVAGVLGAVLAGALGAAWALVTARVLGAGVAWWQLDRGIADTVPRRENPTVADPGRINYDAARGS